MREQLIELLKGTPDIGMSDTARKMIADHLIANGVIVPPTKVYQIVDNCTPFAIVMPKAVDSLRLFELKNLSKYGYYTSQEEAEQALKED